MKGRIPKLRVCCLAALLLALFTASVCPAKQGNITVSKKKLSVNVGFYTNGWPGSKLETEQIRAILKEVKKFANTVRFYGSADDLSPAYKIAHQMGLKVIGTAWLSGDAKADKREMNALIRHCNDGYVSVACVGSETILRGDLTEDKLVSDMKYVRKRVKKKSIPITTADDTLRLLGSPKVCQECDVLMVNAYPYWGAVKISSALDAFKETIGKLQEAWPDKKMIISETGWPTTGGKRGEAKASGTNAARYFTEIRSWSISTGIPVLWFDAADEPWKKSSEGEEGAHWGLLTKDLKLKNCYRKLKFFKELGYK